MIESLDKVAEANDTVRVLKVGHGVTPERLREIIDALQGQGSSGGSAPAADAAASAAPEARLETIGERRRDAAGACLQQRVAQSPRTDTRRGKGRAVPSHPRQDESGTPS